jgi:putative ATP-binding cassette transporter
VSIPSGCRTLVHGSNQAAVSALFRATAGGSVSGSGRILRPAGPAIAFVAERPYLPPGGLREALGRDELGTPAADDRIAELLRALGLERLVEPTGDAGHERDLSGRLSQSEHYLLAILRALLLDCRILLLDRASAVVGLGRAEKVLRMLSQQDVTYICFDDDSLPPDSFDAVLELQDDGGWTWSGKPA